MEAREVKLPSGREVKVREPRGSFAFIAVDMAEGKIPQSEAMKKLIEHCISPKIENWDDFTLSDVQVLISEVGGFMQRAQTEANPSSDGPPS